MVCDVLFKDNNLISTKFDDVFFNKDSGLEESYYVFLQNNNLLSRWNEQKENFVIVEFGFGTGLNFLLTYNKLLEHKNKDFKLHFVSFEKYPLPLNVLQQVHQQFPSLSGCASSLYEQYEQFGVGSHRLIFSGGRVVLDLWIGDINDMLPAAPVSKVDAWFLDGFSPAKNSEMWTDLLYKTMAQKSYYYSTFATFSAASSVRRGLQKYGFKVNKIKGFGVKREMLAGKYMAAFVPYVKRRTTNKIAVVGGGIAASGVLLALANNKVAADVFCQASAMADGASGNHQALIYPLLIPSNPLLTDWFIQAYGLLKRTLVRLSKNHALDYDLCGVLKLAPAELLNKYQKVSADPVCSAFAVLVDRVRASALANVDLEHSALYIADGGWVAPSSYINAIYQTVRELHAFNFNTKIERFVRFKDKWVVFDAQDRELGVYDQLILANGSGVLDFAQTSKLKMSKVRGQLEVAKSSAALTDLQVAVCSDKYLLPSYKGLNCFGASHVRNFTNLQVSAAETKANEAATYACLQNSFADNELKSINSRVAVRVTSRDHLPAIGELERDLFVVSGLGSRGFVSGALAGELLVASALNLPLPVNIKMAQKVNVVRKL